VLFYRNRLNNQCKNDKKNSKNQLNSRNQSYFKAYYSYFVFDPVKTDENVLELFFSPPNKAVVVGVLEEVEKLEDELPELFVLQVSLHLSETQKHGKQICDARN
jgi:hypothetical protein